MKKTFKRIACLFLALCLLCALGPVQAFAEADTQQTEPEQPNPETFVVIVETNKPATVPDNVYSDAENGTPNGVYVDPGTDANNASAVVDGTITAAGTGAYVGAEAGETATLSAGSVTAGDDAVKVIAEGGTASAVAGGDVKSENGSGIVVEASSADGKDASVTVEAGDVTAGNVGVSAEISGAGKPTVTITTGDITSGSNGAGIDAEGGSTTLTTGSISAVEVGLTASAVGGTVTVDTLSIHSKMDGVELTAGEGGLLQLSVVGDVTGSCGTGITLETIEPDSLSGLEGEAASTPAQSGGKIDVLVDGTISGGDAAIVAGDGITADNVSLTVWKVETGKSGHVVDPSDTDDKDAAAAAADIEKNIQYIIRVEAPTGASLKATDNDGGALATSHGYDVAKEAEKVLVKIILDSGYQLKGVYNGMEKADLYKDTNGNYYVIVPRGGGVYLTASVEKTPPPVVWVASWYQPGNDGGSKVRVLFKTNDGFKNQVLFNSDNTFTVKLFNGDVRTGEYKFDSEGNIIITFVQTSKAGDESKIVRTLKPDQKYRVTFDSKHVVLLKFTEKQLEALKKAIKTNKKSAASGGVISEDDSRAEESAVNKNPKGSVPDGYDAGKSASLSA